MKKIFSGRNPISIMEAWWSGQTEKSRNVIVGCSAAVLVFVAGGAVLQAAMTGLLTNAFFWYGLGGRQMTEFMQEWGRTIDVTMTVASIAAGIFVGPTMGLSLVFITGFFSLFRRAIIGNDNQPSEEKVLNSETPKEKRSSEKVDDDIIDCEWEEVK